MIDYYSLFGITPDAQYSEIKAKFRELAKKYHPDLHNGSKEYEEKFKDLVNGFETLTDPGKRTEYDAQLHNANSFRKNNSFDSRKNKESFASKQQIKYAKFLLYRYGKSVYKPGLLAYIWNELKTDKVEKWKVKKIIDEIKNRVNV